MDNQTLSYLNNIADDLAEGILVIGSNGCVLFCNQAAADVFGTAVTSVQGKYLYELMQEEPDNDIFFEKLIEIVYTKKKTRSNIPFLSDGKLKYLLLTTSMIHLNSEELAEIVLIHDVTNLIELALSNTLLSQKLANFLHSFVLVMVEAIEKRSPYNANHTRSMAEYAKQYLEDCLRRGTVTKKEMKAVLLSVWLHDIGKLVIPHSVMDKPTRLGSMEEPLMHRIETAGLYEQIAALQDPAYAEEAQRRIAELGRIREKIRRWNTAPSLNDDDIAEIRQTAEFPCRTAEGTVPLLEDYMLEAMTIRFGTLTDAEREIIRSHVRHTSDLLAKMTFTDEIRDVPKWAGGHHEMLDGSGYPNHLSGDEIPWETRLLSIIDIYDALTAEDRPYKKPMTPEAAFGILRSMADSGKLDPEILADFYESRAWDKAHRTES